MRSLEILGIVLFRFQLVPRIWAIYLIAVNLGGLAFLDTRYGQITTVCALLGIGLMMLIHARLGFVRLLGVGHVFWIPMIVHFMENMPSKTADPMLYNWVMLLMISNTISLIIDTTDLVRYVRGEREPHYVW